MSGQRSKLAWSLSTAISVLAVPSLPQHAFASAHQSRHSEKPIRERKVIPGTKESETLNRYQRPPAIEEALRAQAPRVKLASALEHLSKAHTLDGFVGSALVDDGLAIFWHGETHQSIDSKIEESRVHFRVEVRKVPFAPSQLHAEARRLAAKTGVLNVGLSPDFSHLVVEIDSSSRIAGDLDSSVRVEVKEVKSQQKTVPMANRWDDLSPYYGGAVVERDYSIIEVKQCTTGFSAKRNSDSRHVILTALHCGSGYDYFTPVENYSWAGYSSAGNSGTDSMYLFDDDPVGSPNIDYSPAVYVGSHLSSSAVGIHSSSVATKNAIVCYEGGFTGESCGRISDVGQYANVPGAGNLGPGFWANSLDGTALAGKGDSGGPVITGTVADGSAVGLITAGVDDGTPCKGVPGNPPLGRICSKRMFSANISAVLESQGLALLTTAD